MKQLTDYKNIHTGQDIYVVASGKSCDYIQPSFFDNKITLKSSKSSTNHNKSTNHKKSTIIGKS